MQEAPFILVTGASSGVGYATVNSLIREHGARVLALSRNKAALQQLLSENSTTGRLEIRSIDIAAPDAPNSVLAMIGDRRVHGVVHNAGSLLKAEFGSYTLADLRDLYAINVFAPLLLTQAIAPALAGKPPGHVVHIGSMGGFQDSAKFPGLAAYSASKAALACLAQCVAEEYKEQGIRSNCLALGAVATPMLSQAFPGYRAPTTADEMGRYVARFVLEGHNYFNGKVLPLATTTP